ncbi:MAG: hypothetical protein ACK46L_02475 [Synechococcaceae cyanobacterium]
MRHALLRPSPSDSAIVSRHGLRHLSMFSRDVNALFHVGLRPSQLLRDARRQA